jgi:hypothetical protein
LRFVSIKASHRFLVLGTNKAIVEICVYIKASHRFLVLGTDEAVVEAVGKGLVNLVLFSDPLIRNNKNRMIF